MSDKYRDFRLIYFGEENLAFYPVGSAKGLDATKISHINVEKIIEYRNPKCFVVEKGKVKITISKNFGDSLVVLG